MIPILFCFSSSASLFPLISEMVLLITDPGDHNNSYPVVFLRVQSYFLQQPKYSFPVSASPEDEVKSKHADILDWGEDIISINRLDTQQSMPNDENETSHRGIQRYHRYH
jgi:hypothetical protein